MRGGVSVDFRDSKNDALIRASDIIANQARYLEASGKGASLSDKLLVSRFP